MHIKVRTQTIFLLVGPMKSGKTTFSRKLEQCLAWGPEGYTVEVLSSDDLRAEALHSDAHPHSRRMQEVSHAAFSLLETRFRNAMDWRIRKDFIIIDTKGYDEEFRNMIMREGHANGYQVRLVQFEPNKEEYTNPIVIRSTMYNGGEEITDGDVERMVTFKAKSLSFFRMKILSRIVFKGFDGTERVRRYEDVRDLTVTVTDADMFSRTHLVMDRNKVYVVIPDLHENIDALEKYIDPYIAEESLTGVPHHRIYLGDYLDKGGNTRAMFERIYSDVMNGTADVVAGNHENYVYQRLKGNIRDINHELEATYFTSLEVFLKDEELAAKFIDLYENYTAPFLKLFDADGEMRTYFFTHAPCQNKYVGSVDPKALKEQRNMFFDRDKTFQEQLGFIHSEAHSADPVHVFGHVAHNGYSDCKNKIFLDKGIECNNVANLLKIWRDNFEFVEINLHQDNPDYNCDLETHVARKLKVEKPFDKRDYNLTPLEERLLRNCKRNGVRFISGTMAPAPSTGEEIESLRAGLNAFVKQGVTQVVLQPKYMGSRAQMYLFPSGEGHFFVSRGGYRVRDSDELVALLAGEFEKYKHIFREGDEEPLIIDGELLPWSVLGRDLIDRTFSSFGGLVNYELETLACDDAFARLDFNAKIDPHQKLIHLDEFFENVNLYGQHAEPSVKSFEVMTYRDRFPTNTREMFLQINGDKCLELDLSEGNFEASYLEAKEFFDSLTVELRMEGLVIKPLVEEAGKIPYMKVRNESYLTLIYGYDYKDKYEKLCGTKNVIGKSRLAIKERELGMKMLNSEVGSPEWTEGIYKLITTLREEKALDPRL